MGVVAGIFRVTNKPTQAVNSTKLTEESISLDEAYAQSTGQDKLMAMGFEAAISDGLEDENIFVEAKNTI